MLRDCEACGLRSDHPASPLPNAPEASGRPPRLLGGRFLARVSFSVRALPGARPHELEGAGEAAQDRRAYPRGLSLPRAAAPGIARSGAQASSPGACEPARSPPTRRTGAAPPRLPHVRKRTVAAATGHAPRLSIGHRLRRSSRPDSEGAPLTCPTPAPAEAAVRGRGSCPAWGVRACLSGDGCPGRSRTAASGYALQAPGGAPSWQVAARR